MNPSHLTKLVSILRIIIFAGSAGALLVALVLLYLGIREANRIPETISQPVIGIDEANFQKAIERSSK